MLDKICKRVVWNEVMETYLIQQAHVGKPLLTNIKPELHSAVLHRGREEYSTEQCSLSPDTEDRRVERCLVSEATIVVFLPPLFICITLILKEKVIKPLLPTAALRSLLLENHSKPCGALLRASFGAPLTLPG